MNLKVFLVVLVLLGGGVGGYFYLHRAPTLPDLVLTNDDGSQFSLDSMRGQNIDLVLVLLGPGDPASVYAAGIAREAHARLGSMVSFAGLMFNATPDALQRFSADNQIPFPLYPLKIQGAPNPYAVQEFFELAGKSHGLAGAAVQSGTILVVDDQRRLRFLLTGQEAASLPEKLAKLGY